MKLNFKSQNFAQRNFLPGNWTGTGLVVVFVRGCAHVSDMVVTVAAVLDAALSNAVASDMALTNVAIADQGC